jgi:hypothetical protein
MILTYRTWDVWPVPPTGGHLRKRAPFRADWSSTCDLLDRELEQIKTTTAVLQLNVPTSAISSAGTLKGNAFPKEPGVILCFDSKHGPKQFPCDTFYEWRHNVRAIALGLEALRAVDRYGITRNGEQYTGWARIEGPTHTGPIQMTPELALQTAARLAGWSEMQFVGTPSAAALEIIFREAEKRTHPDRGGNQADFVELQKARAVLLP